MANVPSINSLISIIMMQERVVMFSELLKVKKELGEEKFPVIDQMYFSNFGDIKKPTYEKYVMKVGHGKIFIFLIFI